MVREDPLICRLARGALVVACAGLGGPWNCPLRAEDGAAIEARLNEAVKYLASDELEGRGVGTNGLNKAADYLAQEFSKIGLQTAEVDGGPFQSFELTTNAELGPKEHNRLVLVGPPGDDGQPRRIEFQLGQDFNTLTLGGSVTLSAPLVFAGYGITAPDFKYDDYAGIDVKGKLVVILRKEPQQNDEKSVFNGKNPSSHAPFVAKVSNAFQHGAAGVILVNDELGVSEETRSREKQWTAALEKINQERESFAAINDPSLEDWKKHRTAVGNLTALLKRLDEQLSSDGDNLLASDGAGFTMAQRTLAVYFAKRSKIDSVIKTALGTDLATLEAQMDKGPTPASRELTGWTADAESSVKHVKVAVKNVLGLIPGSGELADEVLVVGAHYDHVGMGGSGSGSLAPWTSAVHNGADDNASGTAGILEVARMVAGQSRENSRRIVFMAFTGEERGLLGSEYYVNHPVFPLEKTAAMVNLDMIGRLNENKLIVYGTGTSSSFESLIDGLNQKYRFDLKKDPAGEGPSDHALFYRQKIPVFHFFTGTHSDYHRPSDDSDRINLVGMRQVTEMVAEVVHHLATVVERPDYKVVNSRAQILRTDSPRVVLGVIPDGAASVEGCRLDRIREGSPAERAGFKAGDIVIKIGDDRVGSVEDYERVLRKFKPGDMTKFTVKREAETVELEVTFGGRR